MKGARPEYVRTSPPKLSLTAETIPDQVLRNLWQNVERPLPAEGGVWNDLQHKGIWGTHRDPRGIRLHPTLLSQPMGTGLSARFSQVQEGGSTPARDQSLFYPQLLNHRADIPCLLRLCHRGSPPPQVGPR